MKKIRKILFWLAMVLTAVSVGLHLYIKNRISWMPGKIEIEVVEADTNFKALQSKLEKHVRVLSESIGPRSVFIPNKLAEAKNYVSDQLSSLRLEVASQDYQITNDELRKLIGPYELDGQYPADKIEEFFNNRQDIQVTNLWTEIKGSASPNKILVIGAHYDSVGFECPGANDNATGVAVLLELARDLKANPPPITVILIAFTCEEPPFFATEKQGSAVFVESLAKKKDGIFGMISLETLGCYSDDENSQKYPIPLNLYYPKKGNFVAFVGDERARQFTYLLIEKFREDATIPSEGVTISEKLEPGVHFSDNRYFSRNGIPALMVTDTAFLRYEHYHQPTDTFDKIDFTRLTKLAESIIRAIHKF